MMTAFRSLARKFGYIHMDELRSAKRAYAAASQGRLLGDWIMASTTADADIRSGLAAVRSRARDLSQNNDLAKAYLRALKRNVVGSSGFTLQVKATSFDGTKFAPESAMNDYLEREFYRWMAPQFCTIAGNRSFRKVQELVVETVARDGEAFVMLLRGEGVNPWGFTLQLIEPDYVDEKKNGDADNGNTIVMGVEMNDTRKPVAYYLPESNRQTAYGSVIPAGPYRRIPASDMIHVYDPERADQTRGISWMASGMVNSRHLFGYIEAAVVNARASACKMGFIQEGAEGAEYTGDGKDDSGNVLTTAEPGTIEKLPYGMSFKEYDPKYPEAQFDPFTKAMIRFVASGLGVSYQTLSGDLSETSYASGRQGLLEERETYKSIQAFIAETFLDRVYSEWLYMGMMTGQIKLPIGRFAKFNAPLWTGRRWGWVDPLKDVQAAKEQRASGMKSLTQIVNENGGDLETTFQEIAAENALAEKYGIELDFSSGGKADGDQANSGAASEGSPQADDKPRPGGDGRRRGHYPHRVLV